jgi:hypothetical protein
VGATLWVIAQGSERLPLIELLVPVLLLTSALNRRSVGWAFAPVAGAIGLYVLFMGTEYLRSWASFYSTRSGSLLEFAFNRLVGYYLTAINNGAYVYGQQPFSFFPLRTSMWLWRLPVPDLPEVLAAIGGLPSTPPALFDNELLNPEFTNSSGIFAPLSDYGPAFGIVVWVLLGHFSGRLYRSFAERRWLGLILFPTWYVGVLELSRLFYWGDQRYFPQLVVSLTVVFIFSLITRRGASLGVDYRILGQGSGRPSSGTIVAPESVQDP